MNNFLLIILTVFMFIGHANAEPKFKYIDTEDKNKKKDEKGKVPPPKPAYYDKYKKDIQNIPAGSATNQKPPQMSPEEMKQMMEALSKTQTQPPKDSAQPENRPPRQDYPSPPVDPAQQPGDSPHPPQQ